VSKKLYVGNISFDTTSDDLVQAFSQYGTVLGAQIVSDRETGRSRGFAFVEMHTGGDEAIAGMNGQQLQGRTLTVNEAKPREERPRTGGGGGGYGGGGGGSRGGYGGGGGGGGRRY
jgi:RNA recognition motif-containing protein